jgi:tRNA modification GTPase
LAGRAPPAAGQVRLERLRLGDEWLDEALAVGLPGAGVELCIHGGPALLAALVAGLVALGGRPEALLDGLWPERSGGLPALERAAAKRLLSAESPLAARLLLQASEGRLSQQLRCWPLLPPAELRRAIEACVARTHAAWPLWRPPRLLLSGPTNAGKSTLFNCLLGRQAALVSALPGTTRDYLEERAPLAGVVVEWIDTAGERERPDWPEAPSGSGAPGDLARRHWELEQSGQRRARALAQTADLVLWLTPIDQPLPGPRGLSAPVLELASFARSRAGNLGGRLPCDALVEPEATCERLEAAVATQLGLHAAAAWLAQPTLFEPAHLTHLAALLELPSSAERWRHLLNWPAT